MPLQYMVSGMAVAATHKYPNESVDVAFNPIGQVVGQFTKVEKSSAVIERSTSMLRHSLVYSSTTGIIFSLLPSSVRSITKS